MRARRQPAVQHRGAPQRKRTHLPPTPTWTCPHCGHIHTPATIMRLDSETLQCEGVFSALTRCAITRYLLSSGMPAFDHTPPEQTDQQKQQPDGQWTRHDGERTAERHIIPQHGLMSSV